MVVMTLAVMGMMELVVMVMVMLGTMVVLMMIHSFHSHMASQCK